MSTYLGIYDGHNASAAVFRDGRIHTAIQEERLTGVKNYFGLPEKAARASMAAAALQAEEIDTVCVASKYISTPRPPGFMKKALDERYHPSLTQRLVRSLAGNRSYRNLRAQQRMEQRQQAISACGYPHDKIVFYDHHHAHAATAYHGLRQDDDPYLVLTLDGGGDGLSGSVWIGRGGQLELVETISHADSLGEIYAVTTHLLGFMPLEHEYKLMGMAPYAATQYAEEVSRIFESYIGLDPGNPLRLKRRVPEPLSQLGPRLQKALARQRFDNICAGLQLFTEKTLAAWASACVEKLQIGRILAAGGVFMNVKANKVLSELSQVDYLQAFPSCGDETLSLGACYLAASENGVPIEPLEHFYLGPDFTRQDCEAALRGLEDIVVEEPADMAQRAAQLLASGEVIARAAGPMEFGARALGNRSILADPINQDVVRVINQMIKKRDFWMPFAPVVLRSQADDYFINSKGLPSPYMMNTFDSADNRNDFMAAVHNADLTARPQLLEAGQNQGYEDILVRFREITGRGVLLNTSSNLHGSPIVGSPIEAVHVLANSGLNHLILGPFLASKRSPKA
jgi:carbamoyltransferase